MGGGYSSRSTCSPATCLPAYLSTFPPVYFFSQIFFPGGDFFRYFLLSVFFIPATDAFQVHSSASLGSGGFRSDVVLNAEVLTERGLPRPASKRIPRKRLVVVLRLGQLARQRRSGKQGGERGERVYRWGRTLFGSNSMSVAG